VQFGSFGIHSHAPAWEREKSKVKMKDTSAQLLYVAVCLVIFTCLISCEKKAPAKAEAVDQVYSVAVDTYKNKGLEITHPADWSLLHDKAGIIADRTVAFETAHTSRITVHLYKSQARTYSDLANSLEQQLRLRDSKDVKDFQRQPVEIDDNKGVRLSWTKFDLSEIKNEVTILQLQAAPYTVLVKFHLFDDDILNQSGNLVPFLQALSFESQSQKLKKVPL